MKLLINSIFTKPKVFFLISHKVIALVRNTLREKLMNDKTRFLTVSPIFLKKEFLIITITTKQNAKEYTISDVSLSANSVGFLLALPYDEIRYSEDELQYYLKYLFRGIKEIFDLLGINSLNIESIFQEIKNEINDNRNKYIYRGDMLNDERL